jgi:DNA-binding transcriptional MerR regulator
MQSIQEIAKQTGLTVQYIRKAKDYLHAIIQPHEQRGNKNALMYDSTGVLIFDRVKQMKQEGLSLPSIKDAIEAEFQNTSPHKPLDVVEVSPEGAQDVKYYVTKLLETQETLNRDIRQKEAEIREKEAEIRGWIQKYEGLAGAVKMLPGGSPEGIKEELSRIQTESEKVKQESLQQVSQYQDTQERIAELIEALKQTEGRFFQGKKRKNLLKQLKTLTSEEK